jgi:hypothetical protein
MCIGTAPARAQAPDDPRTPPQVADAEAASAPDAQPADEDDDATLQPAEPDYTLINIPTTLRLPLHRGNFHLTHRFAGNLRQGSFGQQASNLFGLDNGAVIGLEFRFAVAKHVEAAFYRTSFDKTIQLYTKYDAVHQRGSTPVSISAVASIEGVNNFQDQYAPVLGAVVSRTIDERLAMYASPMWAHNTAAVLGADRDTFYVGLGGRLRLLSSMYIVGEVTPRVSGFAPGDPEYGFGIEKRVGGHFFSLTFTNSFGSTFGQLARGGTPDSLYLGFNLARKFF